MSTIGPIDYIGDVCPDDVVPKLTTEVIDAVTYHLHTCMDDVNYNQVRDAVESFISLINNEATQNNKGKMVQKVAKAANKMIMLQKAGKVEEAFETTQKLMDENKADWHSALTRETRKRRLSGGFQIVSKRPNMAMSDNGICEVLGGGSDTMSTGQNSIDDTETDVPEWPSADSSFLAVEIIERLYFGFSLRPKAINRTVELLRETNTTHILMYCTEECNFLSASDNPLEGKVIKMISHDDVQDQSKELTEALQFIHLSRFEDVNTVIAVCCDSAYYSHSGYIIASYIQAFLGHRIDWGLRAIKGYHNDFAVRPHDAIHFEKFLKELSPQKLESLEEQVGDTNDVKECDTRLYLQGIELYTKWTKYSDDRYYQFGYRPWKLMMEQLAELDYFRIKSPSVDQVIPTSKFTHPCFAQVTANAKRERCRKSDESKMVCN